MAPASQTPRTVYAGLLSISAATLLLEVALTRILSVSLWYHFAYMVVSTALFGFGFAGVGLSLRRRPQQVPARLAALAALACAPAFLLGYLLYNLIPCEPFSLGRQPLQWLWLPLCYLAVSLPFFFSGLTISAILTRHAARIHGLYLFDLAGAAGGSLLVVACLPVLGGSGTVLAAAALAAAGGALVGWPLWRRWSLAGAALAVLLLLLAPGADSWLPVRISSNKIFGAIIGDSQRNLYSTWNTISRIDVVRTPLARGGERRDILIDAGTALTRLAHPTAQLDQLGPGEGDEDFFYRLLPQARVLVVGSGGGREVLMALRNGASRVVAVEINPAINRVVMQLMADFTGRLYQDGRVEVHTDEARSFLRRLERRFDIIHCPHTISNAALASGSLSLAENHLLTSEAFADYLEHLTARGVLLITRPEAQLPRLFVTARRALERVGVGDVSRHLLAWRQPARGPSFYAGFAMARQPWRIEQLRRFAAVLGRRHLEVLYLPGIKEDALYTELLRSAQPRQVPLPFTALVEPATDDRPFFNQRVAFGDIGWDDIMGVFDRGRQGRLALENRPVAEAVLLLLLLQTVLVAALFILLPLGVFRRRALAGRGRLATLGAFFCLGLAYIVVEVAFIQRLTLYLGRPVVVFSTVLGTLLLFSGLGSAASRRLASARMSWLAPLLAGAVAAVVGLLAPGLTAATLAWPAWGRVLLAVAMLVPAGFMMGMPFPLLIGCLNQGFAERIPWAWGVNGFASVVGSISAVVVGMAAGFRVVLLLGVACYLLAALFARLLAGSGVDERSAGT
ncbi:MAG: hypothetical protein DRI34_12565 [Deltaproteobacteria bacterium]|nr:MAG: hypothetical protein DRI34_12565 [Deltaproteobacteria bacterium]